MSYLERTLSWFLKNRIFGGIQKLKQKEYLPFTIIMVFIMSLNTIFALLYHLNILVILDLIQFMLLLELFLSFGIIITGILVGRIKNQILYYLIASIVIALSIFAFISFNWEYNHPFFRYSKLAYFLIWVTISSISLFFLTLYFFTSFPKKVITLGMPKDHIFFGYVIKIFVYISIIFYAYIIFQMDLISIILGIFGFINAFIILFLIKRAPKKVESRPGIINFATAIGFFNTFMVYHLYMSITLTSETALSLIFEMLILLISLLYLVQSLTRRISESRPRLKPFEDSVQLQSRLYFTARIKKIFGERGLVIIVLGIAVGYHMVYLDSFFIADLPILSNIAPNLKMSDMYHRIYLFASFIIILIACLAFKTSKRFKNFMIDKFTIKQVIKYIGGYFKRPEEVRSSFESGIQSMGKKVGEQIKKWSDKWQDSIQKAIKNKKENGDESNKK
ncbi:MAG: hypothetical protein ACFFAN_06425 [Promethearchaeota archaeon]